MIRLDIEAHEVGDNSQRRYLVHGFDDVLWTDDYETALGYLRGELRRFESGQIGTPQAVVKP